MAALLETINAPCQLGLVAFRQRDCLVDILRRVANGQRNGVMTRALLTCTINRFCTITYGRLLINGFHYPVTQVGRFRRGFISLLTVFTRRYQGILRQQYLGLFMSMRDRYLASCARSVITFHRLDEQGVTNSLES